MRTMKYSREVLQESSVVEMLKTQGIDAEGCDFKALKYHRPSNWKNLTDAYETSICNPSLRERVHVSEETLLVVVAYGGQSLQESEAGTLTRLRYARTETAELPRVTSRLPSAGPLPPLPSPPEEEPEPDEPPAWLAEVVDAIKELAARPVAVTVQGPAAAAAPDAGMFDLIVERDQNGAVTRYRKIRRRV